MEALPELRWRPRAWEGDGQSITKLEDKLQNRGLFGNLMRAKARGRSGNATMAALGRMARWSPAFGSPPPSAGWASNSPEGSTVAVAGRRHHMNSGGFMQNYLTRFRLDGQVSVVTGGANGIGAELAEALASAGSDVAILDLDLTKGEEEAGRLTAEYGVRTAAWELDVADRERVPAVMGCVLRELGHVDVLINNAGIWRNVPAEDMPWEDWHDVIDVCVNGTFLMSQCAAKMSMIPNGGGRIINIGSVSGMFINDAPYKCSYNVAKAGVIMLTKALAAEWARYNIRVNCISPCTAKHSKPTGEPAEWQVRGWGTIPMGRYAYTEELCGALLYFASDASSFTTGVNLPVDGGDTIWKGSGPIGAIGGPEGNR